MLTFYEVYLYVLLAVFALSMAYKRGFFGGSGASVSKGGSSQHASSNPAAFAAFQRNFLLVYLIMMAADWMQGPYVYKLYAYYGFSRSENGQLFIAGFGASLLFGTWVGPMADKYGRRFACVAYGVIYALSCATKHFPDFSILMLGRLLGGIATSLLWSSFESWMVSEHLSRGFDPSLIGQTFSLMITLNGLVAIASGFVAQWAVDIVDHPVAPFDLSAALLLIGTLVVYTQWTENYGDARFNMLEQMREGVHKVARDPRVVFTGLQQSLFEGAMYTFVFMWTPTLDDGTAPVPHGLIFAAFMIASSLGGSLFGIAVNHISVPTLMRYIFMIAAATMAIPVLSEHKPLIMGGFLIFETIVGIFWPGIGTLRSQYIPEENRATVTNIFRIPLNLIVCMVLYFQGSMNVSTVFTFCTLFHGLAVVSAIWLEMAVVRRDAEEKDIVA